MKTKILQKFSLLLIFLVFVSYSGIARDTDLEKNISKNYKVNRDTKLDIHTSFGKVHINNWDKNEFDVKIDILVTGSNEERAQKLLDKIEVDIDETSGSISFQTDLNNLNTKNSEKFEIYYTISMPKGNPLRVKNSFGDTFVPDRDGDVELESAYGALKTGELNGESFVKVSFGKADVDVMVTGEAEIKYSDAEFGYLGKVEFNTGFSDIEIEEADELELEAKYGDVEMGKVRRLEADAQFCGFELDELVEYLDMEASYVSDMTIEKVNAGFESIYIVGKFGSYELGIDPELKADFKGEFDFCDLRTRSVDIDFTYKVKDSNESEYRGKINGGGNLIEVKSSYGDCVLKGY